ncbi:MAG: rhomboid family intramembrane serine protease [Proteobacteria bacterium]|nr:rhomboid family intramembrane serine protease [Pseudomonadota bacterium]
MNQIKRKSILCPNCRKLISIDERICPYCSILRPGSAFKNNPVIRTMADTRQMAMTIIWINVAMYIISLVMSGSRIGMSMNPLDTLSPSMESLTILGATGTYPINALGLWWSLISANYLHGSVMHIVFNMLMLWQLLPIVAREYGSYRMISIYTIGGVLGFVVSYLAGIQFTIGASAAVCALVGALLYFGKSRGGVYGQAVYKQISGWVISLFLFGFLIPGINNWAHAGGILGGIAVAWFLGYNDKQREKSFHKTLAFFCAGITILVLVWAVVHGAYYAFAMGK